MDSLSDDILVHIFAQGSAADIGQWQRCCRHWRALLTDDFVWKRAFFTVYGNAIDARQPISRLDRSSWKNEYIARASALSRWRTNVAQSPSNRVSFNRDVLLDVQLRGHSQGEDGGSRRTPHRPHPRHANPSRHMTFAILTPGCLTTAQLAIGSKAKDEPRLSRKVLYLSAAASNENGHNDAANDQGASSSNSRPPPVCYSAFVETDMLAVGTQDGRLSLYEPIPQDSLLSDEEDRRHYWHLASNSIIAPIWRVAIVDRSRVFQEKDDQNQTASRRCAFVLHKKDYEDAVDVVLWQLADPNDSHAKNRLLWHHFVPEMKAWVAARERPMLLYHSKDALFLWSLDQTLEHSAAEHPAPEHQSSKAPHQIAKIGFAEDRLEMHVYKEWFICVAGKRLWLIDTAAKAIAPPAISCELETECKRLFVPANECDFDSGCGFVCLMEDQKRQLLQLRINPNNPQPTSATVIEHLGLRDGVELLDVRIGPVITVILTTKHLSVLDSVSLQLLGKRAIGRTAKASRTDQASGQIVATVDASGVIVALVGGNDIWMWVPSSQGCSADKDSGINTTSPSATRKADLRGSIAEAEAQWNADVALEAHLDRARERLNIDGMNEAELLAYAKMLSMATNDTAASANVVSALSSAASDEDDADLQLALRLSLIEH